MWKQLPNNSSYSLSCSQKHDLEILVTDYLALWFVRFTESDFVSLLKESNTTLELDDNALKSKGIQLLLCPDKLKKAEVKINGKRMQISMSMSFGYSLKLNLGLFEGTKEMFFQKITQPLLKLVQDLKSSEKELRFLLNKKDLEIEEYKSEGAQVVRHFKTSKFDEEKHMNQFKAYSECFGSSDIPNSILERTVDLPEIIIVKQEPAPVKTEPSLPVIKSEPATPVFDDQTVHGTVCVKREHAIGGRSHVSIDAMRLKRSKLNL